MNTDEYNFILDNPALVLSNWNLLGPQERAISVRSIVLGEKYCECEISRPRRERNGKCNRCGGLIHIIALTRHHGPIGMMALLHQVRKEGWSWDAFDHESDLPVCYIHRVTEQGTTDCFPGSGDTIEEAVELACLRMRAGAS